MSKIGGGQLGFVRRNLYSLMWFDPSFQTLAVYYFLLERESLRQWAKAEGKADSVVVVGKERMA